MNLCNDRYIWAVKKYVTVSVTNDLATDQRVRKQCNSMHCAGWELVLIGRKLSESLPVERPYKVARMKLFFNRGAMFYAEYNIRLFFFLLFAKVDVLYANDLDTLPANAIVSLLRGKTLVYDSHEFFTEVPEIQGRWVKGVWKMLERICIHRAKIVITVNQSIANLLSDAYKLNEVLVVRNVPDKREAIVRRTRHELRLPAAPRLLILQGSGINMDRGAEELVEAMSMVGNAVLMIVGSGDALPVLKNMCTREALKNKVLFFPKMPYAEMMAYTISADLALSLDKDTNINYRYSLPNKLFDYIEASVPVLVSDLVELRRVVEEYGIGRVSQSHDPALLAVEIEAMLDDEASMELYRSNLKTLAGKLNWDHEFAPVIEEMAKL